MVVYVVSEGGRSGGIRLLIGGSLRTIHLPPIDSVGISLGGYSGEKENIGCKKQKKWSRRG